MSLKTWKAEFYPTTAKQSARKGALAAAKHSLQKWIGARKKNLDKHGCGRGIDPAVIVDLGGEDRFVFNMDTCSLCARFFRADVISFSVTTLTPVQHRANPCATCPLAIVRDGVSCTEPRNNETRAPYEFFEDDDSPEPMIRWLKKTVAYLEEGKGKR